MAGWQTSKLARKCPPRTNAEVAAPISMEISPVQEDVKEKLAEELSKIKMGEAQDLTSPAKVEVKKESMCHGTREGDASDPMLVKPVSTKFSGVERSLKKGQCCVMIRVQKLPAIINQNKTNQFYDIIYGLINQKGTFAFSIH